jgi:hypothetical protein
MSINVTSRLHATEVDSDELANIVLGFFGRGSNGGSRKPRYFKEGAEDSYIEFEYGRRGNLLKITAQPTVAEADLNTLQESVQQKLIDNQVKKIGQSVAFSLPSIKGYFRYGNLFQTLLGEVIKEAKLKYEQIRPDELETKKVITYTIFKLLEVDLFGDNYEEVYPTRYAYKQCFLRQDRSEPERFFEQMIDRSDEVEWWYKNGEGLGKYFAIEYQWENSETRLLKLAGFYPDYIVKYKDGRTGIYDTKAGTTITEQPTPQKSDALQSYIAEQNDEGAHLKGGILNRRPEGLYIYTEGKYTPDLSSWSRFIA